jgi:hypothetical protein
MEKDNGIYELADRLLEGMLGKGYLHRNDINQTCNSANIEVRYVIAVLLDGKYINILKRK